MQLPWEVINAIGPSWGWLAAGAWILYQLYWPFWNTKVQCFHDDLTARMDRHEVGQIGLAEEVDGADADKYRAIHDKQRLTTEAFKNGHDDGE